MRSISIRFTCMLAGLAVFGLAAGSARAADHVDLPRSVAGAEVPRPDASITDYYAFVAGRKFVMVLDLNPGLSPDVQVYRFPTDVKYRFNVDLNSRVTIDGSVISQEFGGVLPQPQNISEDVVFEITFDSNNQPRLTVTGSNATRCQNIRNRARVFAGLRAEAFIFSPFVRNNIAGIAIEVPLDVVVDRQKELLTWATASVGTPDGTFVELGGRALRSQFPPFVGLNALHPRNHVANGFVVPDVIILDVSKPSAFPNGRLPADDVVTIVKDFTTLETDAVAAQLEADFCAPGGTFAPCPVQGSATEDDVRLLGRFPYLGRPYRPGELTTGD